MNTETKLLKRFTLALFLAGVAACSRQVPAPVSTDEQISRMLTHPRVTAIAEDTTGHIWIGTTHGLNRAMGSGYHQYLAGKDSLSLSDNHISQLFTDRSGRLWIATINGSVCYLTEQYRFRQVPIPYGGNAKLSFGQTEDGTILCNNEKGIYRFDPERGEMVPFIDGNVYNKGAFLMEDEIRVVYPDRIGRYAADGRLIGQLPLEKECGGVAADPDGDLWLSLGNRHKRLCILDGRTLEPKTLPASFSARMDGKDIRGIQPHDGGGRSLLVNTVEQLLVVEKPSWAVRDQQEAGISTDTDNYDINCTFTDSRGNLWIGTDGSGIRLTPNTKKGSRFHALLDYFRDMPVYGISYDPQEEALYVQSYQDRVYRYSFRERQVEPVPTPVREKPDEPLPPGQPLEGIGLTLTLADGRTLTAMSNKDLILSSPGGTSAVLIPAASVRTALGSDHFIPEVLFQTSSGDIWIGTQSDGVAIMDAGTHAMRPVSRVSCPEISSIAEDRDGHIWVATQYGLNEYEPDGSLIDIYTTGDGAGGNAFTVQSSCTLPSGILLFGTHQGIVIRYPSSSSEPVALPFCFEDLRVQNELVTPGEGAPIEKAMVLAPPVRLSHRQNSFSISFSSLDYRNATHGSYSYMLDGFDPFWIDGQDSHEAFYSKLPPGRYTFRARMSDKNGDRIYGCAAVPVTVLPAPWATWWAKLLYLTAALGLLGVILASRARYVRSREQLRQSEAEKRQEQHTSEINKRYFANVAHQLRTPLTMISGPIGTLSETGSIKGSDRNLLRIVRHNVDRMLHLVNQIMDFNALETDALALRVRRTDILPILRRTVDIYRVNADEKGIRFLTDGLDGNSFILADADKIVNILDNLLSNAIKYAPKDGFISVSFSAAPAESILKVANSGPQIPEDKLEKIFERYYQVDKDLHGHLNWGSGVGLYYSRRLAELHHGTLVCQNAEDGAGVCFTLRIPAAAEAYRPEEMSREIPGQTGTDVTAGLSEAKPVMAGIDRPSADAVTERLKPQVLVVDDDTDITFYLRTLLSSAYRVTCCYDAESALEQLRSHTPEIILSDVMMGGISGLELCRTLKEDLQYCHIPVILLTAKDSVRDQIDGLNVGADAYVTKPFNAEYLLSLMDNLLKGRQRLRSALSENAGMDLPGDDALSPQDRTFLKSLYDLMDEELSNAEFNIGDIVDKLHMSHSKFLYKVKGLTGVTPSELFKTYKLNKAAAMLREGKYNISEVSDLTGFSSLAHFSKVFKKKFGVPPSEFK